MARKGTYYLGRVVKTGVLDTDHIKASLRSPNSVLRYGSAWTFVDVCSGQSKPDTLLRTVFKF
ncbi:hypothetical protein, partial [Vibrio sp.]|uniref:hypothetical protein n=1 Tax=Vibrio sp. TaxID=678 RepID=UPI003D0F6E4A